MAYKNKLLDVTRFAPAIQRRRPQSNPNTGGKPTTTIAAQTEYAGR